MTKDEDKKIEENHHNKPFNNKPGGGNDPDPDPDGNDPGGDD